MVSWCSVDKGRENAVRVDPVPRRRPRRPRPRARGGVRPAPRRGDRQRLCGRGATRGARRAGRRGRRRRLGPLAARAPVGRGRRPGALRARRGRAAAGLLAAGARHAVVTLGAAGAILRGEVRADAPGRPVKVVNAAGAGDALLGVLLARLSESRFYPPTLAAALGEAVRAAERATERWSAV